MVSFQHSYSCFAMQIRDRQSESRWDALGSETHCGTWSPTGQPRRWWRETQARQRRSMAQPRHVRRSRKLTEAILFDSV